MQEKKLNKAVSDVNADEDTRGKDRSKSAVKDATKKCRIKSRGCC